MRVSLPQIAVVVLVVLVRESLAFGAFTFTKIADPADNVPGSDAGLEWFDLPRFQGTTAAFTGGAGTTMMGLYGWFGTGPVRTIADFSTPVPGVAEATFVRISHPSVAGGRVAFTGEVQRPDGMKLTVIYVYENGKILPLATEDAPLVRELRGDGLGTLGRFDSGDFSLEGDRVAFTSTNYDKVKQKGEAAIFTASIDGKINRVVDHRNAVPGFAGLRFGTFDDVRLEKNSLSFYAQSGRPNKATLVKGLYQARPQEFVRVVDSQLAVPGRPEVRFREFRIDDSDGENVLFRAMFRPRQSKLLDPVKDPTGGWAALYAWRGGRLQPVADLKTPIPGGTGTFKHFEGATGDGGRIAFAATDAAQKIGIYTDLRGPLEKVLAEGDALEGKTVRSVNLSHQSLSGGRIAIVLRFTDGSGGIYLVSVAGGAATQP